jgi:hypothetical protein
MASSLVSQLAVMLKTEMRDHPSFPFDDGKDVLGNQTGRKFNKPHMKTLALNNNPIIVVSPQIQYFRLGNESAERRTPHYHILEDARTIRNPGKSTTKTRGSQALISNRGKRDYGVNLSPDSETGLITQEYRQDYRSGRRSYWNTQRKNVNRRYEMRNLKRPFRYNIHFGYIERILEDITPKIASFLNLTLITPKGLSQALFGQVNALRSSSIPIDLFTGEIIGG